MQNKYRIVKRAYRDESNAVVYKKYVVETEYQECFIYTGCQMFWKELQRFSKLSKAKSYLANLQTPLPEDEIY